MFYIADLDRFDPWKTKNVCDCSVEQKRYPVIIKTLFYVAFQPTGNRVDFCDTFYFTAFERKSSGHYKTDISGTQDHGFFAGHEIVKVHERLCSAGGKNAIWSCSRYIHVAAVFFATARSKDDGTGYKFNSAIRSIGAIGKVIFGNA